MSKRGTQAQRAAQMTTMRARKMVATTEALAEMHPQFAEVGRALDAMHRQILAWVPSITATFKRHLG